MIDDTTEPALTDAERKNGWCEGRFANIGASAKGSPALSAATW